MSYTPTEWHTGDIVTAEKLNKLEGGVAENSLPSYTSADKDKVLTLGEGSGSETVEPKWEATGRIFPVEMIYDEETDSLKSSKTSTEIISAFNSGMLPYLYGTEGVTITIYPIKHIELEPLQQVAFGVIYASGINNYAITGIDAEIYTVMDDGSIVPSYGAKLFT